MVPGLCRCRGGPRLLLTVVWADEVEGDSDYSGPLMRSTSQFFFAFVILVGGRAVDVSEMVLALGLP